MLWWDTNNRVYGRTNNPYDISRISGGSSGGEGALIASAGSLLGIGSDIGGSIRIPSFFCGIFGHKPTPHLVSFEGSHPYVGHPDREKFLSIGPLCRYACDLKLAFKICLGDQEKVNLLKLDQPVDLSKSKFYFLLEDGDPLKTPVSNELKAAIRKARSYLEGELGYQCEDARLPLMKHSFWIWVTGISDMEAPKLAQELTGRNGEVNGWLELGKSLFGQSHYRKITCLNVILENLLYTPTTRDKSHFRQFVEAGKKLRAQLEALLGEFFWKLLSQLD